MDNVMPLSDVYIFNIIFITPVKDCSCWQQNAILSRNSKSLPDVFIQIEKCMLGRGLFIRQNVFLFWCLFRNFYC